MDETRHDAWADEVKKKRIEIREKMIDDGNISQLIAFDLGCTFTEVSTLSHTRETDIRQFSRPPRFSCSSYTMVTSHERFVVHRSQNTNNDVRYVFIHIIYFPIFDRKTSLNFAITFFGRYFSTISLPL